MPEKQPKIKMGASISDFSWGSIRPSPEHLQDAWSYLTETLIQRGMELQTGKYPPPKTIEASSLNRPHDFVGVHEPEKRKLGCLLPFSSPLNKLDIDTSLKLAQTVGADYYVIHPNDTEKKGESRSVKKEKAILHVKDMIKRWNTNGYSYRLCIENLIQTGYPSSADEIIDLLSQFRKEENIGLIFDLDHHWEHFKREQRRSGRSDDYYLQFENDLARILKNCGPEVLEGYHLAQAYALKKDGKEIEYLAHGLPGLRRGEKMENATPLIYTAPENMSEGDWLNIGKVIEIIKRVLANHSIQETKIIIEAASDPKQIRQNLDFLKEKVV